MRHLVRALDHVKSILSRNHIYNFDEIKSLNDKVSTLMIHAIKISGLMQEFLKTYPDHRAAFTYKQITATSAEGFIFKGATDVFTSKDTPRNYPSLAEWFLDRKFFDHKEPKSPSFVYLPMD
jgi:hypothetical protein